jgi:hypothetical protein
MEVKTMIVMIDCEEGEAKIFDTDTGIQYQLYTFDWPPKIYLNIVSIHNSGNDVIRYFLYMDKEAIQFWQALSTLPGIDPGWVKYHLDRLQNQIKEVNNG